MSTERTAGESELALREMATRWLESEHYKDALRAGADAIAECERLRAEVQTLLAVAHGEQGLQEEDADGNVTYEVNVADLRTRLAALEAAPLEGNVTSAQKGYVRKARMLTMLQNLGFDKSTETGRVISIGCSVCKATALDNVPRHESGCYNAQQAQRRYHPLGE